MTHDAFLDVRERIEAEYDRKIDVLMDEIEILTHKKNAAIEACNAFLPLASRKEENDERKRHIGFRRRDLSD